ncbi:MAG: hypothetical protein ACHQ17_06535 [Polyangia bacterium]|jgi:hypothetical protein
MKRITGLILAAAVALPVAGCGGDSGMSTFTCTATGTDLKFVANSLTVPATKNDFAVDLDGDGVPDNALGRIIAALNSQNLMTQDGVNKAVADGSVVLLMDETADSTSMSSCAEVKVAIGNTPAAPPKYDGSDTFTVKSQSGDLKGQITNSAFTSLPAPVTATTPYTMSLQLPLVSGSAPVDLEITGARLSFTNAGGGIMKGQINGAIKNSDVQGKIIPSVAGILQMKVAADPTSSTNMQILGLFDTGGTADPACNGACKNPDGTCAVANDKKIDICEVSTNTIIKGVLAPDVQLFDASGNYKPTKKGAAGYTMADSLSLGLSFTAVKASF